MSDLKQPTVKADGLMRNVTGVASTVAPAATERDAPARKASKKKSAAPAKKPVTRKKVTGSAKKPAAAKKAAGTVTSPEQPASSPAPQASAAPGAPAAKAVLSGEARQRMISEAAYLISIKRHAGANGPEADWLYAETVIDMVFDRAD